MLTIAGRFTIGPRPAAIGGSAAVYKGVDLDNDMRPVAVKIFSIKAMDEDVLREHFQRELGVLTGLKHPNIVELIDWGLDDGEGNPFIVLEWLEPDLFEATKVGQFPDWESLAPVAVDILTGIAAIQDTGTSHRDLKPENILLTEAGAAKVADFGISKLHERFSSSKTLGYMGTPLYRPEEADDGPFTLCRDVFGFAMLVVQVLHPQELRTHEAAREAVATLSAPPAIREWMLNAIDADPRRRPQSAAAALTQVRTLVASQQPSPTVTMFVRIENRVRETVEARSGASGHAALAAIEDDFRDVALRPGNDAYELQALGDAFSYKLLFDKSKGQWAATQATRLPPSIHGDRRQRSLRGAAIPRFSRPPVLMTAQGLADDLIARVAEFTQTLQAEQHKEQEAGLYRAWRAQLDAKKEVEDGRGQVLTFTALRQVGQQIFFTVSTPVSEDLVGQPRLVRAGEVIAAAGVIESVAEGLVVLGAERGYFDRLRQNGKLEYDTDQSRHAIKVQRQALEAVKHGRTQRPDLGAILSDLARSRVPESCPVDEFWQELDASKQAAVRLGMGLEDMLAIVGPPGTGKTTFIAELVAQYLNVHPSHRVLIASQTHIALDNALERIAKILPDRNLLRIGKGDKIGVGVQALTIDEQLAGWRLEVLAASRGFLREYARELGFDVSDADISGLRQQLAARMLELGELRSKIALSQASRSQVGKNAQAVQRVAPEVYAMAEQLDDLLRRSASTNELRLASEQFVSAGLNLAGQLESGNALAERMRELDAGLMELRQNARDVEQRQQEVAEVLATGLGLESAPKIEELLALAKEQDSSASPELQKLREIYNDWELRFGTGRSFFAPLLARADVVAATCVGLAGVPGSLEVDFDLCILDEASKATPTEALVPMGRSRRWVLVGDPAQLPPFLEREVQRTNAFRSAGLNKEDLLRTVFDMAVQELPEQAVIRLGEQFRMVPTIGNLVAECFYPDQRIKSAPREESSLVALALGQPVTWLDTSGVEKRRENSAKTTSFTNLTEAVAVRDLLVKLQFIAANRKEKIEVAILTGYEPQRELLRRELEQVDLGNIEWGSYTIDEFQGREADVAVLSLTRSNDHKSMGFLNDPRRLNVAVSRGRFGLVVVGDATFCRGLDPGVPVRTVLDYVERADGCRLTPVVGGVR